MSLDVHRKAAVGFDREAAAYDRGRPGYPSEVFDFLVSHFGWTPSATIVDLAAGTGKFTRGLIDRGLNVTAVEPVLGMRERFSENFPETAAVDGTAERMPFAGESVDGVTVAQAFHWFDGSRALPEIHRVLKPGAPLVMVWNRRDGNDGWLKELAALLETPRDTTPSYASGKWKTSFETTPLFESLQKCDFTHVVRNDPKSFIDRVRSISFVGAMAPAEQKNFLDRIQNLLDTAPETKGRADFDILHRTEVWWTRRK